MVHSYGERGIRPFWGDPSPIGLTDERLARPLTRPFPSSSKEGGGYNNGNHDGCSVWEWAFLPEQPLVDEVPISAHHSCKYWD